MNYCTTAATPLHCPSIPHAPHCASLIVWLRCQRCFHGYFIEGSATPPACPACRGGQLLLTGVWDVATEATPIEMTQRREGRPWS